MELWFRRRRRQFRFSDFRFEAAAATLSRGQLATTRSQQLAEGVKRGHNGGRRLRVLAAVPLVTRPAKVEQN